MKIALLTADELIAQDLQATVPSGTPIIRCETVQQLKDLDDNVIVVGDGVRLYKSWYDQMSRSIGMVNVPVYQPLNMYFAEPIDLPPVTYALRCDGHIGLSNSSKTELPGKFVLLRHEALEYLETNYSSIEAAIAWIAIQFGTFATSAEVGVDSTPYQIPASDAVLLLDRLQFMAANVMGKMYSDSVFLRGRWSGSSAIIGGRSADWVEVSQSLINRTAVVITTEETIGLDGGRSHVHVDFKTPDTCERNSAIWTHHGASGNQALRTGPRVFEGSDTQLPTLGPPFARSSPELFAAHLACFAEAQHLILAGSFDGIPSFWEGIYVLSKLYPRTKMHTLRAV